jgi:hypothetical protein
MQLLDCWDRGFKPRWGHGCSPLVFVVCCVGGVLCDHLITRSEEICRVYACVWLCVCVCVSNCVLFRNFKTRRPGPTLGCSATLSWALSELVLYQAVTAVSTRCDFTINMRCMNVKLMEEVAMELDSLGEEGIRTDILYKQIHLRRRQGPPAPCAHWHASLSCLN